VINDSKAEFKYLGQKTNTKSNYINWIKMYRQHVVLHNVMEHAEIKKNGITSLIQSRC